MEIRKIKPEERKEFFRVSQYAFMDWREKDVNDEKMRWMNNDQCIAVWENEDMISTLLSLELKQSVRGSIKRLAGIGNVATYPEYRNNGYIRELFRFAFKDMKDKNISVTMLQPFKETFYQKFGYVSTNRELQVKFHVSGLQHYLNNLDASWKIERGCSKELQNKFLNFASRHAAKHHGMVIYDEIFDGWLKGIYEDNIFVLALHDGKILAACRYTKKEYSITIKEIYWENLEARKTIFSYFARHRDQVSNFFIYIPMNVNFFNWFCDMRGMYEFKVCEGPWMMRIIDMLDAFSNLQLEGNGNMTCQVYDEMCPWNSGKYRFSIETGRSRIEKSNVKSKCDIIGDIKAYSSLLYGGLPLEELLDRNWLHINSEAARKKLEEWLPEKLIFNTFMF